MFGNENASIYYKKTTKVSQIKKAKKEVTSKNLKKSVIHEVKFMP